MSPSGPKTAKGVETVGSATMTPNRTRDDDLPAEWTVEGRDDDVRSWLGPEDRVVCVREGDGEQWLSYAEPRSELGTTARTPLTDGPTSFEDARSAALEYMRRNADSAA